LRSLFHPIIHCLFFTSAISTGLFMSAVSGEKT
jgi:hypothetical protein